MLSVSRCIVLQSVKYGDNSLIIKCLSENGLQSYFLRSILLKNRNKYPFLSYPLSIVECQYHATTADKLPVVNALSLVYIPQSAGFDFRRQAISTFMAEMSLKYIREESMSPEVYAFLEESIVFADSAPHVPACFPVYFGFSLASHLGFGIGNADDETLETYFTLDKGLSQAQTIRPILSHEDASILHRMMSSTMDSLPQLPIPAAAAKSTFQAMLLYFRHHFPEAGTLRSPEILHSLMEH